MTYTWIVATVPESVVIDKISIMSQTTYPSLPLYATISSEVGRQNTEGITYQMIPKREGTVDALSTPGETKTAAERTHRWKHG